MATTEESAGVYKRVGSKSGPLVIGGAMKRMEQDPSFTYVPMFKAAAPLKEMEEWLEKNHKDQKKEALKSAFNKANLQKKSIRNAFEREVENALEERQAQNQLKKKRLNFNLGTVINLAKSLREQRKDNKEERGSQGGSKAMSFKDKVKALKNEGKIWDITNMDSKGHRGRKTEWKNGMDRRRLAADKTDRFYYVVYNPKSDSSSAGVRNFLVCYGGFEDSQIDHVVSSIKEGTKVNFCKGKSPVRGSPILSPKNRKKTAQKSKKSSKSQRSEDDSDDEIFDGISDDE